MPPSIAVTGASGHLGRLTVESMLSRGVPAGEIIAIVRNAARVTDLTDRGVVVRQADYNDGASLRAAFVGVERLMFVSGSEVGRRMPQHRNVVAAAKDADVALIAYTSITRADTSDLLLAADHKATEREIVAADLPYVFLRNSFYTEVYTAQLAAYLQRGIVGAAGTGRVSAASRADLAEAAAAVLVTDGHNGQAYELGGEAFTMAELAAEVSRQSGTEVTYTDLPVEKYAGILRAAGLPEPMPDILADVDRGVAQGALHVEGADLEKLIGRRPTTLAAAIRAAL